MKTHYINKSQIVYASIGEPISKSDDTTTGGIVVSTGEKFFLSAPLLKMSELEQQLLSSSQQFVALTSDVVNAVQKQR